MYSISHESSGINCTIISRIPLERNTSKDKPNELGTWNKTQFVLSDNSINQNFDI